LNTAEAIIYSRTAKIIFNIKGKREIFSFKDRALSFPAQKETNSGWNKSNTQNKAKTKKKGKTKVLKTETVWMVTAVHREYDHLPSLHIESRRMTQVSRLFYALSTDVTSTTLSVASDQVSILWPM